MMYVYHGAATYPEFEAEIMTADQVQISEELRTELLQRNENLSREAHAIIRRMYENFRRNEVH
jgi:hypothetical protein